MASVKMNNMNTLRIGALAHFKSPVMFENYRFICSCDLQNAEVTARRSLMRGVTPTRAASDHVCVCASVREQKVRFVSWC